MKEQLITFETAKLAKEKGFDEFGKHYYNKTGKEFSFYAKLANHTTGVHNLTCTAPTQSLLQKWLREVHKIHVTTVSSRGGSWGCWIYDLDNYGNITPWSLDELEYPSYEEALAEGLHAALKLIK